MQEMNLEPQHLISMATVLGIALLAGAVQGVSPDRWVPLSIHSWQRGWRNAQMFKMGIGLVTLHVALGLLLFFIVSPFLNGSTETARGLVAAAIVLGGAVFRLGRFQRFREVLGAGTRGRWGVPAILSLMGPCELAIPLLMKSASGGQGLIPALLALWVGTAIGTLGVAVLARRYWNNPLRLAAVVDWTQGRGVVFPAAAMALIALQVLL